MSNTKNPIDEIIKVRRKLQNKFANEKASVSSSIIYHYTSAEGLLNILTTKKLWFSDIQFMNDESEITHTFKLLTDVLHTFKEKIDNSFYNEIIEYIDKRTKLPTLFADYINRSSFFVACFSTEQDDLSLWNYYTKTDNMAGYNIGFDIKSFIKEIQDQLKVMHHFVYGKTICEKEKQIQYIQEAIIEYNEVYNNMKTSKDKQNTIKSFLGLIHIFSLFFKTESFKNENEYRFVISEYTDIIHKNNDRAFQITHRMQNGMIIPHIEVGFSKNIVSVVTTSPTIKQDYYKAGVESLLHQNEYHQTKIEISKIPLRY